MVVLGSGVLHIQYVSNDDAVCLSSIFDLGEII